MRRRGQIIWGGILGILVIVAGWKILVPGQTGVSFEQSPGNQNIVVHITGAVETPGVITLPLDARLSDALAIAGLNEEADSQAINMAQKLKDGQKIYIPYQGESGDVNLEDDPDQNGGAVPVMSATSGTNKAQGKININTASLSQLQSLPGIGPSKAASIIAYRKDHGLFMSIEELRNVSGIGSVTFEKLADYITVGP